MKRSFLFTVLTTVVVLISLQSCSKDDATPTEFIADDSSFNNFMNWTLVKENTGINPALGGAHAGNNASVTRKIYFKNDQKASNGKYPVGTIIVKHSSNPDGSVNELTAMVKRGNNFNTKGGDWEWFKLNANGTIASDPASGMKMRGANLMNGMCASCHSTALTDYAFSK